MSLLLRVSSNRRLTNERLLRVTRPTVLRLLGTRLSARLLTCLATVLLLKGLSFFRVTVRTQLLVEVRLLNGLLRAWLGGTFTYLVLIRNSRSAARVGGGYFSRVVLFAGAFLSSLGRVWFIFSNFFRQNGLHLLFVVLVTRTFMSLVGFDCGPETFYLVRRSNTSANVRQDVLRPSGQSVVSQYSFRYRVRFTHNDTSRRSQSARTYLLRLLNDIGRLFR